MEAHEKLRQKYEIESLQRQQELERVRHEAELERIQQERELRRARHKSEMERLRQTSNNSFDPTTIMFTFLFGSLGFLFLTIIDKLVQKNFPEVQFIKMVLPIYLLGVFVFLIVMMVRTWRR